jgi:hypothetical protein
MKTGQSSRSYRTIASVLTFLAALTFLFGTPTTSKAVTTNLTGGAFVPLDFLTAGNQAQVGDKLFSDFTFVKSGDFPNNFGADDLNVIGIQTAGNFGIRFQGGISPNLGGSGDIFLTYTVEVTNPNFLISDLHLAYNGSQVSAVTEEAFANNVLVAHLEVKNPPPVFQDQALIVPPRSELQIEKDIFVRSLNCGTVLISKIDQTFSQVQIPEPTTITLVSAGLLGLLAFARRRDR